MTDEEIETALAHKPALDDGPAATFVLEVIEGPATGARFVVDGSAPSRTLLGESPACTIALGDRQVSRRHVAFDVVGRRLRITDLGSTNGTFVDGLGVVEAYLLGGEIIRVGSSALRVERESGSKAAPLPAEMRFGRVLGASPEMRRLYPLCERLAQSNVPVIIEGETGTGKEALAEALHESGPRAAGPYVVFDCTSVPANLVEAELFGHEKGAFTGAVGSRKGVFELAHGGTLLIDEIGDLDIALQPKLLRAVERGEIRRIGADRPIKLDVRLIAATRRDLDQEVQARRFRDDLFHRLAVARIELPPLRRRKGDVTLLAKHLWREMGGNPSALSAQTLVKWEAYAWPGNVRELRNAVARELALGDLQSLPRLPDDLPAAPIASHDVVAEVIAERLPYTRARDRVMDDFQRRYLEHVLEEHGGDTAKAAAASGIARRYFNLLRSRVR